MTVLPLNDIARIAAPEDNVAIAIRRLEAGTHIESEDTTFQLDATVLEGHRFAFLKIGEGEPLLSWGLPFGYALKAIEPGSYVANESMLAELKTRNVVLNLPATANFEDAIKPYELNEENFVPGDQVSRHSSDITFKGFVREGHRGAGTRNYIILLGTSSLTGSYVKALEDRFKDSPNAFPNIDGVVAVAHTEGGTSSHPNNYDLVLRTLAGFVVHPNVAAVLCVDYGHEVVNNAALETYLKKNDYPLSAVLHEFLSLEKDFEQSLNEGEAIVRSWLEPVSKFQRETVSVSNLKLALQCGGSDAFSGISGNPLAAWVAKDLIRYGGSANLAETDELIGAESYVLQNVKNLKVARKFLATVARFKARAAWHGTSAEGNPSGGNKFRGLYNIVLKSIGAANKKNPDVRLDDVIEYGEPMTESGYYFMDSPGNDLESIAGQVASGCNMIFFVTGNGSVTNFPFVPTIKIVTTSERFDLLKNDMDVNAGAYLDGSSMDDLGRETFDLMRQVASGQKSVGEKAGHSQVQLWRNWQQRDASKLEALKSRAKPTGEPIGIQELSQPLNRNFTATELEGCVSADKVGLILPTSLCSGQVASAIAQRLTAKALGKEKGISRFVALSHTEGCGVSGGATAVMQTETLLNYLRHPFVVHALLLEHGCEKTHNDHMERSLSSLGLSAEQFGWASIQLDGGIDRVTEKVEGYFETALAKTNEAYEKNVDLSHVRLGLSSLGQVSKKIGEAFGGLVGQIVSSGGTVVLPENTRLFDNQGFAGSLGIDSVPLPSLVYGQYAEKAGLHIMQTPTEHWVETLTGLGATGVELVLANVDVHPVQGHPLVPVLQVTSSKECAQNYANDLDAFFDEVVSEDALLDLVLETLSKYHQPKLAPTLNADFQMTRGQLGISM